MPNSGVEQELGAQHRLIWLYNCDRVRLPRSTKWTMHKKGLPLGFVYLNAEVLARGQNATSSYRERPSRSRFSVVSLGRRPTASRHPKRTSFACFYHSH